MRGTEGEGGGSERVIERNTEGDEERGCRETLREMKEGVVERNT